MTEGRPNTRMLPRARMRKGNSSPDANSIVHPNLCGIRTLGRSGNPQGDGFLTNYMEYVPGRQSAYAVVRKPTTLRQECSVPASMPAMSEPVTALVRAS